jgi:hypothetical protein
MHLARIRLLLRKYPPSMMSRFVLLQIHPSLRPCGRTASELIGLLVRLF